MARPKIRSACRLLDLALSKMPHDKIYTSSAPFALSRDIVTVERSGLAPKE
jgi:hypothetical protein